MKGKLMDTLSIVAIAALGLSFTLALGAMFIALGAYGFVRDIAERIDGLWGEQLDDELDELLRDWRGEP